MSGWPTQTVGSLLADERGISVGVMYPGEDTLGGVPLIRVGDVTENGISPTPGYRISPETHHEYRRTALLGGECLITLVGRPGLSVVVPPEMAGWNAARALAVVRLRNPNDARYLTYALSSPTVQNTIRNWCNTTVQATLNLKEIRSLPVPWPEQQVRVAIANAIGSFADKIELNRRMNETLEAMAQAIFHDWFVDFGPVRRKLEGATDPVAIMGGLMPGPARAAELAGLFPDGFGENGLPDGWWLTTLANYADLNPESWNARSAPPTVRYVDLSNTKRGVIESYSELDWDTAPSRARRVARLGDTLVGTVRPGNGSYAFIGEEGLTASTGFALLRPKASDLEDLVYIAATNSENIDRLTLLADGGAYPAVNPSVVLATEVPKISVELAIAFAGIVSPFRKLIERRKIESRTLAETRDYLLPRLMSGEVRVREFESEAN